MMRVCKRCSSLAINHHCHGRDGSDPDLCDVCYWRKKAEALMEDSHAIECKVVGYYNGRCVVVPLDGCTVLPVGLVLVGKEKE